MIRRGDVWWADLPDPEESEPGYTRPVVVVQADWANQTPLKTVIVAMLSSNAALANRPGNVLVTPRDSGLRKPSVAIVSQLLTLNKTNLRDHIGTLPDAVMRAVDDGLLLILELR